MGSALSYLRCQEGALHVYGPVTSAAGAEHLQSPKIPNVYPSEQVQPMLSCGHVGLLQHGLENCCQIRRNAGFRELSQPGLFQPKFSFSFQCIVLRSCIVSSPDKNLLSLFS